MSVKVRKIGKAWGLQIHHNGKRKSVVVGSKIAASNLKPAVELKIAQSKMGIHDTKTVPTLAEVAKRYLEFIEERRAPSTFTRYRGIIKKKIGNETLQKPIDTITRGDIRNILTKHHKKGAPRSTVEMYHSVLSGIFGFAIDDEIITASPTTGMIRYLDIKRSEDDDNEAQPLSAQEMVEALAAITPQYHPIIFTLYHTGLRVGECLALQWGDVDFRNGKIKVSKTAKDQEIRRTTKTYLKREVAIAEVLLSALIKWKKQDKVHCFANKIKQDHIFHDKGRLISDNTLRRHWTKACERIGIGHRRIHDIRHTTASLLLMRGAPILFVSNLLGHSSPKITLDVYAKYIPAENTGFIDLLTTSENTCVWRAFDA